MDAARGELREATRALRENSSARTRRRAEAALVAHGKAEYRLRRSAMRMRETLATATTEEKETGS
jgi:hypothetical protein